MKRHRLINNESASSSEKDELTTTKSATTAAHAPLQVPPGSLGISGEGAGRPGGRPPAGGGENVSGFFSCASISFEVQARKLQLDRTRIIDLPKLVLKSSTIPDPRAGLGVFADERIPKNSLITIYGGKYLSEKEAKRLDSQTHVRTLVSQHSAVDADIAQNSFTAQDLVDKHAVGGFVNSNHNTDKKLNCKYKQVECYWKDFPRVDNPVDQPSNMQYSVEHIMMQATENIERGEELFTSYDNNYWDLN